MTHNNTASGYEAPAIFEIGSLHELTLGPVIANKTTGAFDGFQFQGTNIGIPS